MKKTCMIPIFLRYKKLYIYATNSFYYISVLGLSKFLCLKPCYMKIEIGSYTEILVTNDPFITICVVKRSRCKL